MNTFEYILGAKKMIIMAIQEVNIFKSHVITFEIENKKSFFPLCQVINNLLAEEGFQAPIPTLKFITIHSSNKHLVGT